MLFGDKEWGVRCRLPADHQHKPTDLQTPTPNEWEKIGLYNPFALPTRRKCLRNKQLRRTTGRKRPPFSPQLKHLAVVPAAKSALRRDTKKKTVPSSHDRSLILLMVSINVHRDVNPRLKILSCATNDLRLPNEPLKSEFEIGCCKYSLFHSSHQIRMHFSHIQPKK